MFGTPVCLSNGLEAIPDFAALGDKIVVGVNHQQCGDAVVVCRGVHGARSRGR
jgi:hypothetical protein